MAELAPGIVSDPSIHFGKPVIKGTRVPVEIVVSHIASGISVKDVAKEYQITEQDVYNALNYAAKRVAENVVMPVMPEPSVRGRFFYPNKFGLMHIQAFERIGDKPSVARVLDSAGLNRHIPDNLEKAFDFADISAFCAAVDGVFGVSAGMDIAHRVGKEGFSIGLQNFGALSAVGKMIAPVLSYPFKLRKGLQAVANVLTRLSDQTCIVEENDREFVWKIQECPYCLGRTSNTPICYMVDGFLDGFTTWVTGNKHIIEERKCKARGDQVCEFSIKKIPSN